MPERSPSPLHAPGTNTTVDVSPDPYETRTDASGTPSADALPVAVGDRIGDFRLLSLLGEGGFGAVFQAEDTRLRRKVAIKVLKARALSRVGAMESFLAEARAMAAVQHDHVVPIHQVGEHRGLPYLVMPLLPGESLASRIERSGSLPTDEVRRIGREIASGLVAIHAKRLIHRDLKPGNVWLEADTGRAKVLDLGLASDPGATENQLAGTPAYMSPEQAEGRELDYRSDLFSLGTILYECATGSRPFRGDSVAQTLRAITEETPAPAHRANPAVPSEVSSLIEKLHRKTPDERPASAATVMGELSGATTASETAMRRKARWLLAASTIATIAIISVLIIAAMRNGGQTITEQSVPPPPLAKLTVDQFQVEVHEHVNDMHYRTRGMLGARSGVFTGSPSDAITINAKLSRPAYCFLLAFQPDGEVRCLYPQDETAAPDKTDNPAYPSVNAASKWGLDDGGGGLWIIALVASEEPLPSFEKWRSDLQPIPWKRYADPIRDLVLKDDQLLESFTPEKAASAVNRSEKTDVNVQSITQVTNRLRQKTTGRVAAIAFPVVKK